MADCLVALGSNLGERRSALLCAASQIEQEAHAQHFRLSSLYETPPLGGASSQSAYVNGVARFSTPLAPQALFERLIAIERLADRQRDERWAPRTLDLDLLLYDDLVLLEHDLRVPHPRMSLRDFVLRGACEVAPDSIHPELGASLSTLRQTLLEGWNGLQVLGGEGVVSLVQAELRLLDPRLRGLPVVKYHAGRTSRLVLSTRSAHALPATRSPTLCLDDCPPGEWRREVRAALESVWLVGDNHASPTTATRTPT